MSRLGLLARPITDVQHRRDRVRQRLGPMLLLLEDRRVSEHRGRRVGIHLDGGLRRLEAEEVPGVREFVARQEVQRSHRHMHICRHG